MLPKHLRVRRFMGLGTMFILNYCFFLLLPFHGCFVFFCLIFLGPKSFAFSVYFFHFWSQDQTPIPFRYTLTHSSKISFFEPKKLANNDDRDLRYSMFGAVYLKHENGLKAVPKTTRASTLWEASYIESWIESLNLKVQHGSEVKLEHSRVRTLKPKFWLLCQLHLSAGTAVRLSPWILFHAQCCPAKKEDNLENPELNCRYLVIVLFVEGLRWVPKVLAADLYNFKEGRKKSKLTVL